jgi:signal peptidase
MTLVTDDANDGVEDAGTATAPEGSAPSSVDETLAAVRDRRNSRTGRGLLKALGYGLGIGALALVLLLAVVTVIVPKASGATTLSVLTGSMRPKFPEGTLLVVKSKPLSEIHIGNVITYEPNANDPHTVVTHRVVAITTGTDGSYTFTTKGDNNTAVDAPVAGKQVVAVLWYSVPWMGWISNGRGWIPLVLAVLLVGYALYTLVGNRRHPKTADERSVYRPFDN